MVELPLNEDGSVDTFSIWTMGRPSKYGMTGLSTTLHMTDLVRAIEAHTIERCAKLMLPTQAERLRSLMSDKEQ